MTGWLAFNRPSQFCRQSGSFEDVWSRTSGIAEHLRELQAARSFMIGDQQAITTIRRWAPSQLVERSIANMKSADGGRKTRLKHALVVVAVVAASGCSDPWASITGYSVDPNDPKTLFLRLNTCTDGARPPKASVSESINEVRVLVPVRSPGNTKACVGTAVAQLTEPVGTRQVINDRTSATVVRVSD